MSKKTASLKRQLALASLLSGACAPRLEVEVLADVVAATIEATAAECGDSTLETIAAVSQLAELLQAASVDAGELLAAVRRRELASIERGTGRLVRACQRDRRRPISLTGLN